MSIGLALAAALLPALPASVARADQGPDLVVLPAPPPPAPLPDADRVAVPASVPAIAPPLIADMNLNGTTPSDILNGLTAEPTLSGPTTTVWDTADGASHLLQAITDRINQPRSDGGFIPIVADLTPDLGLGGPGWSSSNGTAITHFPALLSVNSPIKVEIGGGSYTFFPEGLLTQADLTKTGSNTVRYPSVGPGVDLTYTTTDGGFLETITIAGPTSPSFLTFDVATAGLTLRPETTGEISVLSGTDVVGVMPAPFSYDSSHDPVTGSNREGPASYSFTDLGGGRYRIGVAVDPAFASTATYPLSMDPPLITRSPSADTYTDSGAPNTGFGASQTLRVGIDSAGNNHNAYLGFDLKNYIRPNGTRIVYSAQTSLLRTDSGASSSDATMRMVNNGWPNPVTWNSAANLSVSNWSDSRQGGHYEWYNFQARDQYQAIIDGTAPNNGVRLGAISGAANYHEFASAETDISGAKPQLFIRYDDLPDAPIPSSPADGTVVTYSSPTLHVQTPINDPNGDPVRVSYEISKSGSSPADFTGANLVGSSDWLPPGQGWVVPAGTLQDGQKYWWRAKSWDVCDPPDGLCSLKGKDNPVTPTGQILSFSVSLNHTGDDSRWAMYSDSLGNAMTMKVNEATGNLYLNYPLDSLATAVGPLDLGLSYNSQARADNNSQAADYGLGPGWVISAGPESDPGHLPVKLVQVTTGTSGDAVKLIQQDGDQLYFPKQIGSGGVGFYAGTGAQQGVIKNNADGTWLYTTTSGGSYQFDSNGQLTAANPSTSTASAKGFSYVYTNGRLTQVTDPFGRSLTIGGWGTNSVTITSWASDKVPSGTTARTWKLTLSSGRLLSVLDPAGETVSFSYDGTLTPPPLNNVWDGVNRDTSISYTTPTGLMPRVSAVTDNANNHPTRFSYVLPSPFVGQVANQTIVTDPRGPATSDANDYTTTTDFDHAGLPVRIAGPANTLGELPVTRMAWDTNGNLVCKRSPAANAVAAGCKESDPAGTPSDKLQTDYVYASTAPYRVLAEKSPVPNIDGSGLRPVTTYAYDEGIQGLLEQDFDGGQLQGLPASQEIGTINHNWGTTTTPPGITDATWWSVKWTGVLHVTTDAQYAFRLYAHDGAALVVGGKTLADCFDQTMNYQNYNCGSNKDAHVHLQPGDHPITVVYGYRGTETPPGDAHINLQWDAGSGGTTFDPVLQSQYGPDLGLLTTKADPAGTTTYSYKDDVYRLRHLPDSETRTDNNGNDPRTTAHTYDSYGRPLTTTTPAFGTTAAATVATTYFPDTSGLDCVQKVVDATGAETDTTCDGAGDTLTTTVKVTQVANQLTQDRVTTTTYDGVGRVASVTTTDGTLTHKVVNTYDHAGRLTQVDDQQVNSSGAVTGVRTTTYVFDDSAHTMKETKPDPGNGEARPVIWHYYNEFIGDSDSGVSVGNENRTQDAAGSLWKKFYDASNRVVKSLDPYGNRSVTTYDDLGQGGPTNVVGLPATPVTGVPTVGAVDPSNVTSLTWLDLLGRKTSTAVGGLSPTTYVYDAAGNVTSMTDPTGVQTLNTYNAYGQVTKATSYYTDSTGAKATANTFNTYDPAGRLTQVKDPKNNITTFGYDLDGRITSVTPPGLPSGHKWSVLYDAAGERVKVTDPDGRIRHFTYDALGRAATATDGYTTTNHYDAYGEVTSVDDPRGFALNYVYDGLGRKIEEYAGTTPSTTDPKFTYFPTGALQKASNDAGAVTLTYDDAGRVYTVAETSSISGALTPTTTYQYGGDPANPGPRLTKVTDSAGDTSFTYDSVGRIDTITEPFGGTTHYTYDDAGRELTRKDPALITTARTYDTPTSGRLVQETVTNSSNIQLAMFTAQADAAGNVSKLTQKIPTNPDAATKTWNYTYTPQNELSTATSGSTDSITYGYDGAGNRKSVQTGTTTVTTNYDPVTGLPTTADDGTTYAYDHAGNLLSVSGSPDPKKNLTFTYDAWGRQINATGGPSNISADYTYDALDRLLKRTGSTTTYYAYTGQGENPSSSKVGTATTMYGYTPGGVLEQCTSSGSPGSCASGSVRVFEPNMHGDLAVVANVGGTTTGSQTYGPFGDKRTAQSGVQGDAATAYFSFQSDPTDPNTGYVDEGTRLYDPGQGRFSTRDVLFGDLKAPTSLNQFVYGNDNPLSMIDPNGMDACRVIDGVYYICPPSGNFQGSRGTVPTIQVPSPPPASPAPPPAPPVPIGPGPSKAQRPNPGHPCVREDLCNEVIHEVTDNLDNATKAWDMAPEAIRAAWAEMDAARALNAAAQEARDAAVRQWYEGGPNEVSALEAATAEGESEGSSAAQAATDAYVRLAFEEGGAGANVTSALEEATAEGVVPEIISVTVGVAEDPGFDEGVVFVAIESAEFAALFFAA